jgi:hypothetical protein
LITQADSLNIDSKVILVRGEDDITWSPLVPELVKHLSNFGLLESILDVSDFSFPKFRTPPRWVMERYSLRSGNELTKDLLESIKVEFLKFTSAGEPSLIPGDDLSEIERSVTSTLITLFADADPKRHKILEPFFRAVLTNRAIDLYSKASKRFHGLTKLTVVLPNGRFSYQRAIDLAARRAECSVLYYERGFRSQTGFFLGQHPTQDREAWQNRAQSRWIGQHDSPSLDQARGWFEQRRIPNSESNEFASYWSSIKEMKGSEVGAEGVSVSFFTSSQDEYLALDGWEGFGWADQYSAFAQFASRISGNKVLRIHPNFINKSFGHAWDEMKRVLWFAAQDRNIKIVWPNDATNTYNLIEKSERIFVHGSTVGLEASAYSKSVWNSGSSIYDTYADVRKFEPNTEYAPNFFEPWAVNNIKSLQIIEEMIDADIPLTEGVVSPRWNSSNIPILVRIYNLILVGSVSYFLLLVQKSMAIRANKILIFFFRNVILRNKKYA